MKHEIEIEGLPEGWDAIAFRIGEEREYAVVCGLPAILTEKTLYPCLIVKKKQPRRIVLEETDEVRKALKGDYIERIGEPGIGYWGHKEESNETYKIWREVKETATSLHNADDNESLRLSVDECRKLLDYALPLQIAGKIIEFIQDK